ncbi:MAG: long-chain fatty acid--CoA ligase [Bacteroidaceae bacterium]|nr:long-chain fatty acid--CoA ligase [Bacteroidaceae bacterium]MBO6254652.1 AMP-binding protein [Bacteroidaceae bacterium]MBQ8484836.1 AMP-binding protein [Bacteroidaceae bacterium]MBQ9676481.1 AMP-binding protein [Bacteroidaceae bacterium]
MEQGFLQLIEDSIKKNWDLDALTDYNGATLQYKDVARKIEKVHIFLEEAGVKKGDKIAICGRNSSHWGVTYLAILTYGAIVVPILHEFKADNIHHIVNHSDARMLYVGDRVWEDLNEQEMPKLEGIMLMTDFSVLVARNKKLLHAREHLNEIFGKKYPKNFRPEHVQYYKEQSPDELAMINYTSGTTSSSKGVMIPYRALWSNMAFAQSVLDLFPGDKVVSILPMAHTFGMSFEFLYEFVVGCHVYFLTRIPSPKIIAQAFADVKPRIVIAVPLVVEKIIKKKVLPQLEKNIWAQLMLNLPVLSDIVKKRICEQVTAGFGGNFIEVIMGGAPLNKEVESFLRSINFKYTVGYGMTECAPIISYEGWDKYKPYSCGKAAPRMEIKIDSPDPQNIPGEILTKGMNVMLGYYKNEEATKAAITPDGWLHTGDLGVLDAEGNLTIRGRSKNMILGPDGQNIYPEEIESELGSMPYVSECIVIQQEGKLVGLVYPDFDLANKEGIVNGKMATVMEENRVQLNQRLPNYCQISRIKIFYEEFEKTPKKSIKRYLYQNA